MLINRSLVYLFSLLPLVAATTALLVLPTGCGPIGCFAAQEAGGTCPPQEEALPYFGDPECGGRVASVDSGPSLRNGAPEEGTLCCYAVTNKDPEFSYCGEL